jgi:hypothetical protein
VGHKQRVGLVKAKGREFVLAPVTLGEVGEDAACYETGDNSSRCGGGGGGRVTWRRRRPMAVLSILAVKNKRFFCWAFWCVCRVVVWEGEVPSTGVLLYWFSGECALAVALTAPPPTGKPSGMGVLALIYFGLSSLLPSSPSSSILCPRCMLYAYFYTREATYTSSHPGTRRPAKATVAGQFTPP